MPVQEVCPAVTQEYISRHRETLSWLGTPGFLKECREGFEEIMAGGGKNLLKECE